MNKIASPRDLRHELKALLAYVRTEAPSRVRIAAVLNQLADGVATVGKQAARSFPPGALVLVDGRDKARVVQVFPEGSSSYLFPHYKLDFVNGDRNVAVNMKHVGVKAAR